MTILSAGIDTLRIEYETGQDIETIKLQYPVVEKHTKEIGGGKVAAVIKPSRPTNGGVEPTTVKETLITVGEFQIVLGMENGIITRVDIAADTDGGFKENIRLFRLFLECLNLRRRGEEGYKPELFRTDKGLEIGNTKIMNGRTQTTVYDCTDKARRGKARIENRITDIRSKEDHESVIVKQFRKYLKELELLEELVPIVEERCITVLHNKFHETIGVNFINFSEFVAWADMQGLILTEGILKGLLKKCGITTRFNNFTLKFRANRSGSLKFSSKTELKKLVQDLKKELKKALKN